MKISDQEIKDVLDSGLESPSYGFVTKTMRSIESRKNFSNEVFKPLGLSKWIMGLILLIFVGCILYSFTIDSFSIPYLNLPSQLFFVFWLWSLTVFFMAVGLWVWILIFLKTRPKF